MLHNSGVITAGHFNFLAIQWEEGIGCIQSSPTYGIDVNYLFIEIVNDTGLYLTAHHSNHILHLALTPQPDLINDINVVPGISDHVHDQILLNCFSN